MDCFKLSSDLVMCETILHNKQLIISHIKQLTITQPKPLICRGKNNIIFFYLFGKKTNFDHVIKHNFYKFLDFFNERWSQWSHYCKSYNYSSQILTYWTNSPLEVLNVAKHSDWWRTPDLAKCFDRALSNSHP